MTRNTLCNKFLDLHFILVKNNKKKKKRWYLIVCARGFSGITLIIYAQSQNNTLQERVMLTKGHFYLFHLYFLYIKDKVTI